MLQTLLKIGKWQSHSKSKWDRFLEFPEVKSKDGKGNSIKNYTLPIIFDLDEMKVIMKSSNLREYDKVDIEKTFPLKIKGGNNKAIYSSVPAKKINQLYKTFFGKENDFSENGQLLEAINKLDPSLITTKLEQLLSKIFDLKDQFLELAKNPDNNKVDINTLTKPFDLNRTEKVVFVTSEIKSVELGYNEPIAFAEIDGYREFLIHSYLGDPEDNDMKISEDKLCYASGEFLKDVVELNLIKKYSLNKMFVTTTKNYATFFDKNNFTSNYQVNVQNQEYLDYASDYLLHQGYKVKIAGLDHVIIPQFLSNSDVDLEMALEGINRKSDILFNLNKLESVTDIIQTELDDKIFWINYFAFDSDGNFFKSTGLIKDVSNYRINKLLTCLNDIDWWFRDTDFFNWDSIMSDFIDKSEKREPKRLNFYTFYKIIPLRDEKRNKALDLFKSILENRRIMTTIIFENFVELILCHYYQRYEGYSNKIKQYSKDNFFFATRDSVFQYLALIQFLNILKLIDMDEPNQPTKKPANPYEQNIQQFFDQMEFNQDQQAMFYLGQMLNKVEYIQKGKTKTVIQKVNFNGMDRDDIQRLRIGLIEKAKQYNAMGKVIFIDRHFGELFNYNAWQMNPKEAVFFLLTGYSFGASTKDAKELEEKESIEIN